MEEGESHFARRTVQAPGSPLPISARRIAQPRWTKNEARPEDQMLSPPSHAVYQEMIEGDHARTQNRPAVPVSSRRGSRNVIILYRPVGREKRLLVANSRWDAKSRCIGFARKFHLAYSARQDRAAACLPCALSTGPEKRQQGRSERGRKDENDCGPPKHCCGEVACGRCRGHQGAAWRWSRA